MLNVFLIISIERVRDKTVIMYILNCLLKHKFMRSFEINVWIGAVYCVITRPEHHLSMRRTKEDT